MGALKIRNSVSVPGPPGHQRFRPGESPRTDPCSHGPGTLASPRVLRDFLISGVAKPRATRAAVTIVLTPDARSPRSCALSSTFLTYRAVCRRPAWRAAHSGRRGEPGHPHAACRSRLLSSHCGVIQIAPMNRPAARVCAHAAFRCRVHDPEIRATGERDPRGNQFSANRMNLSFESAKRFLLRLRMHRAGGGRFGRGIIRPVGPQVFQLFRPLSDITVSTPRPDRDMDRAARSSRRIAR